MWAGPVSPGHSKHFAGRLYHIQEKKLGRRFVGPEVSSKMIVMVVPDQNVASAYLPDLRLENTNKPIIPSPIRIQVPGSGTAAVATRTPLRYVDKSPSAVFRI